MLTLDLERLEKEFLEVKATPPDDFSLPKGMDRERFLRFIQLMNCQSEEELEEISMEDIVELFAFCDEYAECLLDGDEEIASRKKAVEKARSAMNRRIL